MRHKESNNSSIKTARRFPFWQKGHFAHAEEREIIFGFQASLAWTKCIDFQTAMLGKGEKWQISFDVQFSPYLFLLVSFGFWPKRSMKSLHALRCWRAWGCRRASERLFHEVSTFFISYTQCRQTVCSFWPFTPGPTHWALLRGVGTSKAQVIHPLFDLCFQRSSHPGSACLSSLHQLTCKSPNHRQSHCFGQIFSLMSASSGHRHSKKGLDIYSSLWSCLESPLFSWP